MDAPLTPIPPYARMVRFASTDAARSAYQAVQDFIFQHEEVDLSVYNLVVARVPHVVVLGEQPGADINGQLTGLLADGVATQLPPGLIRPARGAALAARRAMVGAPPWLPGEPLP